VDEAQDDLIARYSLRQLRATLRTDMTKLKRRQMRRENRAVFGTVQGGHLKDDIFLHMNLNEIRRDFREGRFINRDTNNAKFAGPVYNLIIEKESPTGGPGEVVERVRAYAKQLSINPVTEDPLAVGFVRVPVDQPFRMEVPFAIINAEKCSSLKNGYLLRLIKCLHIRVNPYTKPPECCWVDLENRKYGTLAAGEVILPPGCDLLQDPAIKVLKLGRKV